MVVLKITISSKNSLNFMAWLNKGDREKSEQMHFSFPIFFSSIVIKTFFR